MSRVHPTDTRPLFSMIVGVGLMAVIFYSGRYGYDEPPKVLTTITTRRPVEMARSTAALSNALEVQLSFAAQG